MSKGLYIGATSPYAGKNMLSLGIGARLQKEGCALNYMKPVGCMPMEKNNILMDEDAHFIQSTLGLESSAELVTPVLLTQDFKMRAFAGQENNHLATIKSAYTTLAADADVTIVAGSGHMLSGKYCKLDGLHIAKELGLNVLVVDRLHSEVNYDILMAYKEALADNFLGAVINDVPPSFMSEMNNVIKPFLENNGIKVLGVLPHDAMMSSLSPQSLAELLGGRLITAQNKSNGIVESFLIGTMQVENFMTYFRKQRNAAVIVGGDRADVQLVAIEGECPCLVLTGNLYPNDIILSRAETLNVPIILLRDDTYSVAKKMEILLTRHKLHDTVTVHQAIQLVSSHLDFITLRQQLGI